MKARIDNKVLNVKVINANYNETSTEVQILEGAFQGAYAIVNNNDLIQEVTTIKQLESIINNNLLKNNVTKEELDNSNLVELLDTNTYNIIKQFSNNYKLSNNEYKLLIDNNYGKYNYCTTIEEVKVNILLDVIENRLNGTKATYTTIKRESLNTVKSAYNL